MPKVSAEHKVEVKEAILKAAVKNFGKYGYANTKMDDIAKTADVSKGTLYLYFPSKEEMFQSVCKQNQQILIEERSGLFRDKKRLESDLGEFYDNFSLALKENLSFRIEAIAEAVHNPKLKKVLHKNSKEFVDIVTEILKQRRKEGGFHQKKVDLRPLAAARCALYDGVDVKKVE